MPEFFVIEPEALDAVQSTIPEDTVAEVAIEDRDVRGEVLRIQERIGRNWDGVRSCGDARRISNELESAMRAWAGEQMLDHPGHRLVRWGHGAGTTSHRNSGGGGFPRSPRSCRGSLSVPAYIVFIKPA